MLYATIPVVALALWPGAATRYATPALLAVAALAGLCFDRLIARRARSCAAGAVDPGRADRLSARLGMDRRTAASRHVRQGAHRAQTVEAATRAKPYTIFAPLRLADPVLAYLDRPVQYLDEKQLMALPAPAYLLADPQTADMIGKARPDLAIVLHATIKHKSLGLYELVHVRPRRRAFPGVWSKPAARPSSS